MSLNCVYGIALMGDGRFMMAHLVRRKGQWRLGRVRSWDSQNPIGAVSLLNKGVVLGVPSHWRGPCATTASGEGLLSAQSDSVIVPRTPAAIHDLHRERLTDNLLGTVADDAFLCTVPSAFDISGPESFVSISREENFYRIGVIISRQLRVVFHLAPDQPEALGGHLARIRRYWELTRSQSPFPEHAYHFGGVDRNVLSDGGLQEHTVPGIWGVSVDSRATAILRASGAALALHMPGALPWFTGASAQSGKRTVRAAAYVGAASLVALTAVAAIVPLPAKVFIAAQTRSAQARYDAALGENRAISELIKENNSLARKILRLGRTFSDRTRWTRLLEAIGDARPAALYLDRIGSESIGDRGFARLVLTGWAPSEELVTEFMGRVKRTGLVSELQLSSLVRDPKDERVSRFKIICRFAARESAGR